MVVAIGQDRVAGASAGDPGAWLIGPGGPLVLTAGQQRKPLLGSGEAVPVPFSAEFGAETLLVSTDGLFNYAGPERIVDLAVGSDLEEAARQLVNLVRLPSGGLQDDVAVVLVRAKKRGG